MKKVIWITFFIALVVINLAAWGMDIFAGVFVPLGYRLATVLGITFIAIVFAGAWMIVGAAEKERERD